MSKPVSVGVAAPQPTPEIEALLVRLVERFYEIGNAHPVLGPVFAAAIHDWPTHIQVVADFWSKSLFGTDRYGGNVFASHMRLPVEPVHFDLWLEIFKVAAAEVLPPNLAEQAIARANHMTHSIQVGLFPYRDAEGKPTRKPPF